MSFQGQILKYTINSHYVYVTFLIFDTRPNKKGIAKCQLVQQGLYYKIIWAFVVNV